MLSYLTLMKQIESSIVENLGRKFMIKILTAFVLVFILLGCGSTKKMSMTHQPFQMVDKKDATLVQKGSDKESCARCGMNLVRFYKTSHSSVHKGKSFQYCSFHCLEDHLGEGIVLKNPQVVDITSLKFIPVAEANYVVGSSKRGTMTRTSKYAFRNIEAAKKFKKQYGGEIMSFSDAREIVKEDFKHYRN